MCDRLSFILTGGGLEHDDSKSEPFALGGYGRYLGLPQKNYFPTSWRNSLSRGVPRDCLEIERINHEEDYQGIQRNSAATAANANA
jgi:hypothetical protein